MYSPNDVESCLNISFDPTALALKTWLETDMAMNILTIQVTLTWVKGVSKHY